MQSSWKRVYILYIKNVGKNLCIKDGRGIGYSGDFKNLCIKGDRGIGYSGDFKNLCIKGDRGIG